MADKGRGVSLRPSPISMQAKKYARAVFDLGAVHYLLAGVGFEEGHEAVAGGIRQGLEQHGIDDGVALLAPIPRIRATTTARRNPGRRARLRQVRRRSPNMGLGRDIARKG